MSHKKNIEELHWGQLSVLWTAFLFVWVVVVGVMFTISPDGQASFATETFLFALLVLGVAIMLAVTFTWFGGRKRLSR
jgi:hypothetical protein